MKGEGKKQPDEGMMPSGTYVRVRLYIRMCRSTRTYVQARTYVRVFTMNPCAEQAKLVQ